MHQMGGPNRGGRGSSQKNKNKYKKVKETNSESSDSDISKKSSEDFSKEADLDTVRKQARDDYVSDEIYTESRSEQMEVSEIQNHNLNPLNASSALNAAPGDECRTRAKLITAVKSSGSAKRRRHSMNEDASISEQIFDQKSFEEQTVIVVTNLSTEINKLRLSYLKEHKAIRGEIKTGQETTAVHTANKIEALNASIKELKAETEDGKKCVQDLVTAVETLSTTVMEQNKTIQGLVTGKVDLKDSTDLQNKITDVLKGHLKSLSDTVVKYSDRNLGVTQSRANEIKTATTKIENELEKSLKTSDFLKAKMPSEQTIETIIINEEISNMGVTTANYTPNARGSSSGANSDGTHNGQKLTIGGMRPGHPPPPKTYADTTKTGRVGGLPLGAPPLGQSQRVKNNATFERMEAEGPTMIRKDYATFPDGNIKWNEHYEPKKPELTEVQKKRRKTKWEKDREKTDKEVLIFLIPTRDVAGRIHSREYDNAQVVRLLRELARGGFFLKPGDIAGTIRQIQNDRHPEHLPITVTCKDKETAENIITAASNIFLNGGRRPKLDDVEKGRFGYFRPSLSEAERKAIKERHKQRETLHGKGQAEIRQRKYDSQTNAEEWSDLIREEFKGEEEENLANAANIGDPQTPHENMVVEDTEGPRNPTPTNMQKTATEDENLNRLTPPKTAAPTQSSQEKEDENEKLKRQLAEITKQAESLANINNHFRQRNATLEELTKNKN